MKMDGTEYVIIYQVNQMEFAFWLNKGDGNIVLAKRLI